MSGVTACRILSLPAVAILLPAIAVAVDYARDIEPILHERCYLCHGEQQQMAGLRLDSREAALKGSERTAPSFFRAIRGPAG